MNLAIIIVFLIGVIALVLGIAALVGAILGLVKERSDFFGHAFLCIACSGACFYWIFFCAPLL